MFKKLKKKFTILATASMLLLMTVLVSIMNIINYSSMVSETDAILDVLSQPNAPFFTEEKPPEKSMRDFIPRGMSPEVPYESRFFTVLITPDGDVIEPDFSRIVSVDDESSKEYVNQAIESGKDRGFAEQFRYLKTSDDRLTRILFLDCGRKLETFRTSLWTSIGVGLLGCLIVFIVFLFVSGKIVKPIAESYEKQKRFISDAGHEIKTPLTIIRANADLLEIEGEKDELNEILQQTERLTDLTNNLVLLSKMEEVEDTIQKIEMPLSDIVSETAASFKALAVSNKLALTDNTEPGITINGAPDAIRRLVSILLENAVKYSPVGGTVSVNLKAGKKTAVLSVENQTRDTIKEENLKYVFDRFYRTDASRNSATGGHGIGLSIARAIVDAHDGSITASSKGGNDFCVTVILPM